MSLELAMATMREEWTRDEVSALARRLAIIRTELKSQVGVDKRK